MIIVVAGWRMADCKGAWKQGDQLGDFRKV